ncbi:hypothetical protein CIB84_017551, partial [Bambusicola thoracicus]
MPPHALCLPGSWCHGTGRRRSRVQLIAVCAAPGAHILVLLVVVVVVISTAPCSLLEPYTWVGQMLKPPDIPHSLPGKDFMLRYQGPANCWIGLHREEEDAQWTWSDGTAFTNWSVCPFSCPS